MIKKDFHYVLRRVLVYFAILFVFSFINSCDVKALENTYYINKVLSQNNTTVYDTDIPISYSQLNNSFTFDTTEYSDFYSNKTGYLNCGYDLYNRLSNGSYDNVKNNYDYWFIIANSYNNTDCGIYYFNKDNVILRYTNEHQNSRWLTLYIKNAYFYKRSNYSYNNITNNNLSTNTRYLLYDVANNSVTSNYSSWDSGNKAVVLFSSEEALKNVFGNVNNSTINSLGVVKNKDEEEKVIVSYTFNPTFNNFDTTTYKYQYKIGDNNWLTINSNDITFNVNQNTSVYFRVVRLSNNETVDSQTYTITNILKYNDNINDNYNIKYSSENKSVQDESSVNRTIDRVTVNFEYFPKQSNLKYQYQYVKTGDSLSSWTDMPSNDYDRGYTVTDNGTMYNRILDENDTVLFSSTFTVNSIGKLMFDTDTSWYNSLFNKINYGSGIGTIFYLPLKIVQTVHDSYSDRCDSVNLGSLLGTSLIIPCIDIESIIGSTLYNIIDIIFMGFIALSIIRFVVSVYNRIISLNFEGNEDGSGALFL